MKYVVEKEDEDYVLYSEAPAFFFPWMRSSPTRNYIGRARSRKEIKALKKKVKATMSLSKGSKE